MCCKDTEWVVDSSLNNSKLLEYGQNALENLIARVGANVNKHLLEIMFEKYKFYDHCLAIKRYLLLGQGDFIQYLMDLLGYLLQQRFPFIFPPETIYRSQQTPFSVTICWEYWNLRSEVQMLNMTHLIH